jgi:hypothetical protein
VRWPMVVNLFGLLVLTTGTVLLTWSIAYDKSPSLGVALLLVGLLIEYLSMFMR